MKCHRIRLAGDTRDHSGGSCAWVCGGWVCGVRRFLDRFAYKCHYGGRRSQLHCQESCQHLQTLGIVIRDRDIDQRVFGTGGCWGGGGGGLMCVQVWVQLWGGGWGGEGGRLQPKALLQCGAQWWCFLLFTKWRITPHSMTHLTRGSPPPRAGPELHEHPHTTNFTITPLRAGFMSYFNISSACPSPQRHFDSYIAESHSHWSVLFLWALFVFCEIFSLNLLIQICVSWSTRSEAEVQRQYAGQWTGCWGLTLTTSTVVQITTCTLNKKILHITCLFFFTGHLLINHVNKRKKNIIMISDGNVCPCLHLSSQGVDDLSVLFGVCMCVHVCACARVCARKDSELKRGGRGGEWVNERVRDLFFPGCSTVEQKREGVVNEGVSSSERVRRRRRRGGELFYIRTVFGVIYSGYIIQHKYIHGSGGGVNEWGVEVRRSTLTKWL